MDKKTLLAIRNKGFDKQRQVFRDKSKRIALFVGRRGAKTTSIAILFLLFAYMHKNIRLIFIGLTGENAENAFLPAILPILQEFDLQPNRDYTYNNTERLFTFHETNSTISLKGNDNSYKEMDKILGGKCFAVAIDECQSQTQDLEKAILYKIQQAVSDYLPVGGGIIILSGTAGDYMGTNFWYRITTDPNHLGWSFHHWLDKENPHMLQAKLMEDAMFEEQYGPNFREEQDWYQQQYMCKWIPNASGIIYKYTSDKNDLLDPILISRLLQIAPDWSYIIGMDFGYEDDNALVVGAFNKYDKHCYIVDSYKQNHLQLDQIAELIQQWKDRYKPIYIVGDAQDKIVVETLRHKYRIPIVAANKLGKFAHIADMNADFVAGNIKVIAANNQALIQEWANLTWNTHLKSQGIYKENQSKDNHLADACFIKGTQITTSIGDKNIEDMKVGDLVLTRAGYQPVLDCGISGIKPTFTLTTMKGKQLTGTHDHPIYTKNQFDNLSTLKTGDILTYTIQQQEQICQKDYYWNTKGSSTADIQTLKTAAPDYIGLPEPIVCTESFGPSTLAEYLTDIISIILTAIHLTMISLTYNLCPKKNTNLCIVKNDGKTNSIKRNLYSNWHRSISWLKNGTLLQKVWSGINNMAKIVGRIDEHIHTFVSSVINHIILEPRLLMCAETSALLNNEGCQARITKLDNVNFANRTSPVINTPRKNIVADHVMTVVENQIEQPVYNLTVANQPEYYANGILVHNCLYLHHFSKHYRAMPAPKPDPAPMRTQTEHRFLRQQPNAMLNSATETSIYDSMDIAQGNY